MEKLQELFNRIFCPEKEDNSGNLIKIIFSAKRRKSLDLNRVTIRPLILGGQLMYQAEYTYPKKVTHANLSAGDAAEMSLSLIANDFKQVNIFLTDEEIQVLAAKPENPRITSKRTSTVSSASLSHNRTKQYIIPDGTPCDFLIELGVMGSAGKVFPRPTVNAAR